MKNILYTSVLALTVFQTFAQYAPIEYDSEKMVATAVSSEWGRFPQNAIDTTPGFGLDEFGEVDIYYDYSWTSENVGGTPLTTPAWFRVDLGETFNIAALRLWNYNLNRPDWGDYTGRSIRDTDIFVSTNDTPAVTGATPDFNNPVWKLIVQNHEFEQAPGEFNYAGE
ncbi:MAG: hypothetical protein FWG05_02695, partial [Kiritimatiellaeota bacterium]|nr:hypothetical protein [Kiritimatiellota bacterium]